MGKNAERGEGSRDATPHPIPTLLNSSVAINQQCNIKKALLPATFNFKLLNIQLLKRIAINEAMQSCLQGN